jgi:hypothetical protein
VATAHPKPAAAGLLSPKAHLRLPVAAALPFLTRHFAPSRHEEVSTLEIDRFEGTTDAFSYSGARRLPSSWLHDIQPNRKNSLGPTAVHSVIGLAALLGGLIHRTFKL